MFQNDLAFTPNTNYRLTFRARSNTGHDLRIKILRSAAPRIDWGLNDVNLASQYLHFFADDEFIETDRPGFRRRVITGEHLQLCFWRIAGGATGSFLHKHDEHEQLGIIVRGSLDFRIFEGDETEDVASHGREVVGANQAYLAPRGVWHGDSIFVGDDEYGECWNDYFAVIWIARRNAITWNCAYKKPGTC